MASRLPQPVQLPIGGSAAGSNRNRTVPVVGYGSENINSGIGLLQEENYDIDNQNDELHQEHIRAAAGGFSQLEGQSHYKIILLFLLFLLLSLE